MYRSGRYLSLLVFLVWPLVAGAQPLAAQQEVPALEEPSLADEEVGLPFFFEHFSREDYRQHHQNWTVVQDAQGIVYVGNYNGILEFDGTRWNLIETPADVVRSLAIDAAGVVYAGVQGDFGYLRRDSTGALRYVSLVEKMAPRYRDFADVWGTHAAPDGVYFQTPERLFRWDGQEMTVWESESGFHTSFFVRDQLYVREYGVGLLQLVDDEWHLIPGGEQFADARVYMMAPYAEDDILIATREAGLFLYDGTSVTPFPTEVDAYLRDYPLYHGTALPGGLFALATLDGGGTVLIDDQGRFVRLLNEPAGVLDDLVNYVYADAQGGLWLALDSQGVVRVDAPSALSRYNRERGIEGSIIDVVRYRGRLYAATSKGLYVLEQTPLASSLAYQRAVFRKILGESSWSLFPTDSLLFVGTGEGLFVVRGEEPAKMNLAPEAVYDFLAVEGRDGQLFLGREDGLALLEHGPEGWRVQRGVAAITDEVRSIAAEGKDTLWVATAYGGQVFRFRVDGSGPVEEFSERDGLPRGDVQLMTIDEALRVVSFEGVFRYRPDSGAGAATSFYRDAAAGPFDEAAADSLLAFTEDEAGDLWMVYRDRVEIARPQADGSYARETPPVLRFPKANIVHIYVEEDGIVWFGNGDELIRYDPHFQKPYDAAFTALIRTVTAGAEPLIVDGAPASAQAEAPLPTLDYDRNSLRFAFAAPSYNAVQENRYQYYLEGRDTGWSAWTYRQSESYNSLKEGRYRFRVRARNAQGVVSDEAAFAFRILPPWYRTWWAFGFYVVLILAATGFYWRYRVIVEENKRAQEQVRELARERLVNERLQQANKRLQEANEGLLQVNKLKDEFLATTSHELRTPLTAILGFTAVLQEELSESYQELLDPIESNGQRLLNTVNSLLELAKLRAGMMQVQREVLDVGALVAEAMRLLGPLAHQKALRLDLTPPARLLLVNLDRRFLEQILNNLIGNAIKFTKEGRVHVTVAQEGDDVCIRIADTGIGIDEAFIPYLFDEFKQESSGLSRLHEGSGLGLSITARLVELMDGAIEVESRKGQGSVFTVSFPLYHPSVEDPAPSAPRPAAVR